MLTLLEILKLLTSAKGVFDTALLIVLIINFFYLLNYIRKKIRRAERNTSKKMDGFRRDYKKHFESLMKNEIEKLEMKINFLDKLIGKKILQEKTIRELEIEKLHFCFKNYLQDMKDILKKVIKP